MVFPMHQVLLVMIELTHVVGSLNWKNGMFVITGVRDIIRALQTTVT